MHKVGTTDHTRSLMQQIQVQILWFMLAQGHAPTYIQTGCMHTKAFARPSPDVPASLMTGSGVVAEAVASWDPASTHGGIDSSTVSLTSSAPAKHGSPDAGQAKVSVPPAVKRTCVCMECWTWSLRRPVPVQRSWDS